MRGLTSRGSPTSIATSREGFCLMYSELILESAVVTNSALIICTRNRPETLANTLSALARLSLPETIVIVDSSENGATERVVNKSPLRSRIVYLASEKGLPHQRNVGIRYLRALPGKYLEFVSFLDDDVIPSAKYFLECKRLFSSNRSLVCLGGFDSLLEKGQPNKLAQFVGVIPKIPGSVSKAGLTSVCVPKEELREVQWVPGGMQNIRWSVLQVCLFDGRLEFFGEDLEMHLRIGKYGTISVSDRLPVRHLAAQEGKPALLEQMVCQSMFRWHLANQFPGLVKRHFVIFGSLALIFSHLVGFSRHGTTRYYIAARAEIRFLFLLAVGRAKACIAEHPVFGPEG